MSSWNGQVNDITPCATAAFYLESPVQAENERWARRDLYLQQFDEEFLQRKVFTRHPHILIKKVRASDSDSVWAALPRKMSLPGLSKAQPGKEIQEQRGRQQ